MEPPRPLERECVLANLPGLRFNGAVQKGRSEPKKVIATGKALSGIVGAFRLFDGPSADVTWKRAP